jgi:hypothetical protein
VTYVVKTRLNATVVALYTCPEHGVFECEVLREPNGDAPEQIACDIEPDTDEPSLCPLPATWTPSATIGCRVRRVEVVRGKYEKPERKTYLDTRKLGEGQDVEEFQSERQKMWTEQRRRRVRELLR